MALSNKEKQNALRKRRALLGQKRREYYLTDNEKSKVDGYIQQMKNANKKVRTK